MIRAMLYVGTASALAIAATGAFAQESQTTETTQTTTTTDASKPVTKTKTKSKTKTTAPSAAATPATPPATDRATNTTSDANAAPTTPAAAPATAPAGATAPAAPAKPNPTVGGAAMEPTKTIVENASAAPNLTTLVSAVKAADLATTLSGPGPFTVFAPTNDAFSRVDKTSLATLLKPENKAKLTKVLTYHVVPGTITAADLVAKADAGGGTTTLTTVEGEPLTVKVTKSATGAAVEISDVNGNKSYLETADVRQSNGVVHVVNGVLFPKLGN